jgi:AraC-like DNA-binding protein
MSTPIPYPAALLAGQLAQARFQATPLAGKSTHGPLRALAEREIRDYDIHYVSKGAMEYDFAGRTVRADAGSFCLLPPRRKFLERNALKRDSTLRYCHFEIFTATADPMQGADLPAIVRARSTRNAEKSFDALLRDVTSWRSGATWNSFRANSSLLNLLAQFFEDGCRSGAICFSPQRLAPQWLDAVLEKIDSAVPDDSIDINRLAQVAHLSPSHFAHQFRRYAGISPKQMLLKRRMDLACALMLNSDMAVKEIAARCGYPDPYQFSAIFKKWTKYSPSDYRGKREMT